MRRPPKVPVGDPSALADWVAQVRPLVEDLYGLLLDGTAKRAHRLHARVYIRDHGRRCYRSLGALLDALDPGAPAAPGSVDERRAVDD